LLSLLVLGVAAAGLLDAWTSRRPAGLERWVDAARLDEIAAAGTREPDLPESPRVPSSPDSAARVSRGHARPPEPGRSLAYDHLGRLDLNRADANELDLLPGVGPALAARILEERRRRGRFASVKDLLQVRGIGPKTLAKLLPRVRVGAAKDSLATPESAPDSAVRFAR